MRLESEHTHYRTRFEMYAYDSADDVAPYIMQIMYNWLRDKEAKLYPDFRSVLLRRLEETAFNYQDECPDHVSTECYVSRAMLEGMSCPTSYDGGVGTGEDSKLCTRSLVGEGSEMVPQYWAMDYDEPDTNVPERRWHTSVGISSQGKRCVVNVRITNYLLPTYVGSLPETPVSTTPNFVRSLISCKGFQAQIGSTVLSRGFTKVRSYNYKKRFLKELGDAKRELPVIVVATDYEGKPPTSAYDLAYKVLGMAQVLVLDFSDYKVRDYVRKTFAENTPAWEHRITASSVRIYKPGVNPRSVVDARRHRFFAREDIDRLGSGFNDMLARSLTRGWVQDEEDVVDVLDVAARARHQRNVELRRRLDELSRASEERAREGRRRDRGHEANATIAELREMLEERNRAIDELEENATLWQAMAEEYANDLEEATAGAEKESKKAHAQMAGYIAEIAQKDETIIDLDDQVSKLSYQLKTAWDQVKQVSGDLSQANGALAGYEAITHVPDRLSELLDLLEVLYPQRVCVLPEARKSALDFDDRYVLDDELLILKSIPTTLWDLYFGAETSGNIAQNYQAQSGFELAPTEGSMTNKGAKYMKQRERTYHGETISISPHIKGRSGNPKDNFRLHYYVDKRRKLIVIGHCGAHLETAGTNKAKH